MRLPLARSCRRIAVLVLLLALAGCASDRGPAEQALVGVEEAYAKIRPRVRSLAPERAAEFERQLERARTAARDGDWVTALAASTALPGELERLSDEIGQREEATQAAWDSTNTALAARLQEVDAAIERRAASRPGPAADEITAARTELAAARVAWSQAIAAREDGLYDQARIKAGEVQLRARRALSAIASP
jgi:hypothetical protein